MQNQFANKKQYLKALKSGKYLQQRGYLCVDGKYCCLGVFCKVSGLPKTKVEGETSYYICFSFKDGGRCLTSPKKLRGEAKQYFQENIYPNPEVLMVLNDASRPFEDIALVIESGNTFEGTELENWRFAFPDNIVCLLSSWDKEGCWKI